MSEAFESYRLYTALKLHFTTPKYDYFKYRGKTFVDKNPAAFDKRKDRYFYYKLYSKYKKDLKGFYIAVFTSQIEHGWIGELLDDNWFMIFTDWLKRQQSLKYTIENDINSIIDILIDEKIEFKSLLKSVNNEEPIIMSLYDNETVQLETITLISMLTDFHNRCNIDNNPKWDETKLILTKYQPFVKSKVELGWFKSMLMEAIEINTKN